MRVLVICFFLFCSGALSAQSAAEILQQSEEILRGVTSSQAVIKMTIQRPKYTREMKIHSWTVGDEYALMYIAEPVRDKGTVFLKKGKEIWNWVPSIEKVIKLPPSMMMQSWMGSDFTNDDLVKSSSMVDDYAQTLLEEEEIEGRPCHVLELFPNDEAAVVWGKLKMWIDKEDSFQLKTEFYDEDGYLINTMEGSQVKELGGKMLPSVATLIPEEDPDNRTIIEYLEFEFDQPKEDNFFSIQNMKRMRVD